MSESKRETAAGPRFWLWIDGVGGFLVCESARVSVGQPTSGTEVDIPLLADISREHAWFVREDDRYWIESRRGVRVAGKATASVMGLESNNVIELTDGVRLRFVRPHPLSATARLEFVSHHRTSPAADGVLLLAGNCLLGPAPTSHIQAPAWQQDVMLYRQGTTLHCRYGGELEIDGTSYRGSGPLAVGSRVVGADFCFRLESAG